MHAAKGKGGPTRGKGAGTAGWGEVMRTPSGRRSRPIQKVQPQQGRLWRILTTKLRGPHMLPTEMWVSSSSQPLLGHCLKQTNLDHQEVQNSTC